MFLYLPEMYKMSGKLNKTMMICTSSIPKLKPKTLQTNCFVSKLKNTIVLAKANPWIKPNNNAMRISLPKKQVCKYLFRIIRW